MTHVREGMHRRAMLKGLLALTVASPALAACLGREDVVSSTHPALRPTSERSGVALLGLPLERAAAVRTLRTLAERTGRTDDVRVMVALGRGAFDRTGGTPPAQLQPMAPFAGDLLLPARTDADVLVQVEGEDKEAVEQTARSLVEDLPVVTSWSARGQRADNRSVDGRSLTTNAFGFTDGIANPDSRQTATADLVALIPAGRGEQAWAVGGSYLALRVIRLATAVWDKDPVDTQERIMGRRRDGRWLDGRAAHEEPDFAADPEGVLTPLDSHVRRANPRTAGAASPRLIRRSWSYDGGTAEGGHRDEGLLFMAYQADLEAGFLSVQRRLVGQALDRYLLTVGGGYFWVPPAGDRSSAWLGALPAA
jgi:deferrochelatase/peroxidase EfeB